MKACLLSHVGRPWSIWIGTMAVVVVSVGIRPHWDGLAFADNSTAAPASLRLVPEDVLLHGAEASQTFLVMGTFADGTKRDLTLQAELLLSNPDLAVLSDDHRIISRADGELLLTATVAGTETSTTVRIEGSQENHPFRFSPDMGAILTRRGCNGTKCHGAVPGQGGFKLSINGSYPQDDYQWIVEGGHFEVLTAETGDDKKPRIDLETPENSLLLKKATEQVSHGGGLRFDTGSPEYAKILQWIRDGAPFGPDEKKETVKIDKLEVYPKDAALDLNATHQILVTAHLSNGKREDLTRDVVYESTNDTVLEVNEKGLVTAKRPGETNVFIRAPGKVSSVRFGVIANPLPSYPNVPTKNFIDQHVFTKLRALNIIPSELSSDAEFLRRLCLDLTGTLPPPNRVKDFLVSNDPQKRDRMVEILLNSPEFEDYLFYHYSELFRWYGGATQLAKDTQLYGEWLQKSISENKPYDQLAVERIAPEGYNGPSRFYYQLRFLIPPEDVVAEHVRVYFGRRLDCARCHDHPFEAWTQDQFWGMAAFYSNLVDLRETVMDNSVLLEVPGTGKQVVHPRTKEVVAPQFLDGTTVPADQRSDLRMKLAEWIVAHPYFSETFVNRVWAWFFGKGIVDPVDDFRANNPPSHPELLRALAADFQQHEYDVKHLIRVIVRSRTYQLSGTPNATNNGDRQNFSHALPRPLNAAVFLDAIAQFTEVPNVFVNGSYGEPPETRSTALLPHIASDFLDIFGRNKRNTLPEGTPEPTLTQSLHMLTGTTFTEKVSQKGGRIDRLISSDANDQAIIEELYLAALSRFPTPSEAAKLKEMIQQRTRQEAFESLVWALICSRQFTHIH